MTSSFKREFSLEKRTSEAKRIVSKYPERIPVIVEKVDRGDIADIDKKKYVIRKRIRLEPDAALYLFVGYGSIPQTSALMSQIYESYSDADGFLYITYSGESTFGLAST